MVSLAISAIFAILAISAITAILATSSITSPLPRAPKETIESSWFAP